MESNSDYVTLGEAVRILGMTREVLNRRIVGGALPVFCSGKDTRLKLVARKDLDELVRIKPLVVRSDETVGSVRVA